MGKREEYLSMCIEWENNVGDVLTESKCTSLVPLALNTTERAACPEPGPCFVF